MQGEPALKREQPAVQESKTLASEEYVVKTMPPVLGTLDMTAIFVAAIFYITNSATAVAAGAAAFTYWILCGVTFFIPCVLATAQLGVLFPYEGALYNWTHRALGNFWSFFTGFCAWLPGLLALVSGFGTAVTYLQRLRDGWLTQPWQQGLVITFLILLTTLLSVQRLRVLQTVLNASIVLLALAVVMVGIAGGFWLISGHSTATSFRHASDWSLNPNNLVLFGFLVQSYLGTEVALTMAGETVKDPGRRVIKHHLLWGTLLVIAGYLITTFSVLVIRGPSAAYDSFVFVSIVDQVLGKLAGNVAAVCLLSFFVVAPMVYNYAFARLLLVASIDGRLPTGLARLNTHRAPANAILLQSAIALAFTALAYFLIPYIATIDQPADLSTIVFNVSLAALTLVWLVSIPFLFIDLLVIYLRDREALLRRLLVPLPLLWLSALLGSGACVIAIVDTLLNSWIPDLLSNAAWWTIVGGVTVVCLTLGMIGSMIASSEAAWEHWKS